MKKINIIKIIFLFSSFHLYADPWFTGPILAPAGRVVQIGHINFELYGFWTTKTGSYDRSLENY